MIILLILKYEKKIFQKLRTKGIKSSASARRHHAKHRRAEAAATVADQSGLMLYVVTRTTVPLAKETAGKSC